MAPRPTAKMATPRPGASFSRGAAVVVCALLGVATEVEPQVVDRVRLSLLEASAAAESRACTLEVVVDTTAGEAVLTCHRSTPPVSHLGAHRVLTTAEATRIHALASGMVPSQSQSAGSAPPPTVDRPTATLTITRGTHRVVLDVSDGPTGLSEDVQQTWRLLRDIADELRR